MSNILELKDVNVTFNVEAGQLHILRDVSLEVPKGSFLCVVGESGCGKSVTAQAIVQLLPDNGKVESGSINFYDQGEKLEINKLEKFGARMRGLRGAKIGMIFQDTLSSLNPAHRVGRQVAESLLQHMDISKEEAKTKVIELFKKLGIPDPERRYEAYPHEFSGGMRQRVMIAMALINDPEVLIADEPTTALDVTVQAQILELLRDLQKEFGTAIVLITHDLGVVADLADEVMVMYGGSAVEHAEVREIFYQPQMPYTWGLLASVPRVDSKQGQLDPIPGSPPSLINLPKGCVFSPRCTFKDLVPASRCLTDRPELLSISNAHEARCHLTGEQRIQIRSERKIGRPN